MSLAEIEEAALGLSEPDRAALVAALLDTLAPQTEIGDEEALRRDQELETGRVEAISHEEFTRQVEQERGK